MSLADRLQQPSLEQVMKNHQKVARAAIRLKHSIAADNELEHVMAALKVRLAEQAQEGRLMGMSVADMLRLVEGGEDE